MRKNTVMRILSVILVMTLISTCAISGTFAKYVTKVEGSDAARVAKWGIVLTMEGDDFFKSQYETDEEGDNAYQGEYSVVHDSTQDNLDLVAPGTKGDAFKATVYGTPEVATRYSLEISNLEDVVLPAGEYTDYTELVKNDAGEYGYFNNFAIEADYYPIVWDLEVKNAAGTTYKLSDKAAELIASNAALADIAERYGLSPDGVSLSAAKLVAGKVAASEAYAQILQAAIDDMVSGASNLQVTVANDGTIKISMDFDPLVEMDYTFSVVWKWAFEADTEGMDADAAAAYAKLVDQCDTYLGNYIAGATAANADNHEEIAGTDGELAIAGAISTNIAFNFVATAVQID